MKSIYDVLKSLGIYRTYKGYYYVAEAVRLVMKDASLLLYISKSLYPAIARVYVTTVSCVERNIRTIITTCWESGNIEQLEKLAGTRLYKKPTTGEFIDILPNYLNLNESQMNIEG